MSSAPAQWRRLRVPASSANLGPGFDALGMALDLHLECRFRRSENLVIRTLGRDRDQISSGEDNLIWKTASRLASDAGAAMPPLELELHNAIPLGKGLGSSAAALTAAAAIANDILGLGWDDRHILQTAAEIEGHPDNVAACVLGSIVASAVDAQGNARAVRMDLHPSYNVAVVVPDFQLPTSEARSVLPASYSKADAIFNIQRTALLTVALATGSTNAFPEALGDRMHQSYRAPLVPGLEEIVGLQAPGLLGCALSGAGPSILVFHERGHENVCELVRAVFAKHGRGSEVACSSISREGYRLS